MHQYILTGEGRELILQETATGSLSQIAPPLLASGFSSQSPDYPCPLSPTLQLNADLATSSLEQLRQLAIAERKKLLSAQLKSYVYTVEPRAAVIAADPKRLADFLDLYGSVLETVPILFSSTSRQAYIPADELHIQTIDTGGYLVRCSSRVPIDPQQCTWCRACVGACEEQSISSELKIDFDRCTLCGDCVDACPTKAIDLYARIEKEFKIPAVILLGDPEVELPADQQMIFTDQEVETFLRQVGDHQIEETVVYHRKLCQYSGRLDLGCHQCLDACIHGALHRGDDGISIDYLVCQDCGACVAACPTGALQDQRFHDRSFIAYFDQLDIPDHAVAVLGSEQELLDLWWHNPNRTWEKVFFLEYPQVNTLTAMHYLFLFALGFAQVAVLHQNDLAKKKSPALKELELGNNILTLLFSIPDFITFTTDNEVAKLMTTGRKNPLDKLYDDFSYRSRRQKMASLLEFLLTTGSAVEEPLQGKYCTTYGQLICDEDQCTACVACLNECYTGALTTDQQHYILKHEPALCVQCGICVAVCPENALSLDPGLVLAPRFFQSNVLSQAEPMICQRCGAHFGTRKSYQHVINLLRETGRFTEQEDVLVYCETCRAVKMFESYAK
ncbi:MAG: hypothetical protein GWP07_01160 [Xanthomonadaceae bacterium]|nr:hypothetical protein [Xanthomonadaceae bacterium]